MDKSKYSNNDPSSKNSNSHQNLKDADLAPFFERPKTNSTSSSSQYSKETSTKYKKPGTHMFERPDGSKHWDYGTKKDEYDKKKSARK